MSEICKFCGGDELRPDLIRIAAMPGGTLYFHKDQTHPGRLLFAAERHVKRATDLPPEEFGAIMRSVHRAACVLNGIYAPDKINYLILGDLGTHLHVHIVPKYKDGKDWGKMFLTDEPRPVFLKQSEYQEKVEKIRNGLNRNDA
ncbi:HIT family protein [Caproiciproducens sp. NJN-50]|uniref:HIT family protein n=1 Tax=Acutalibacteraceae TaxID=3082771 RepID=UPI000FFE1B7F|nr:MULTISPECIES: HIT family protein [Acutalibacteraceae]QAT50043.1 HIT family protein [Caproiciproducens sp. NJN-50]